jgi:hypothetical protein
MFALNALNQWNPGVDCIIGILFTLDILIALLNRLSPQKLHFPITNDYPCSRAHGVGFAVLMLL